MTYEEAVIKREANIELKGKEYNGDIITDLLIVPENGDGVFDIIQSYYLNVRPPNIITTHTEFTIIAVFVSDVVLDQQPSFLRMDYILDNL